MQKVQTTKEKIDKLEYILKWKLLCIKSHYKKSRRQVTDMNLPYDLEFHF